MSKKVEQYQEKTYYLRVRARGNSVAIRLLREFLESMVDYMLVGFNQKSRGGIIEVHWGEKPFKD